MLDLPQALPRALGKVVPPVAHDAPGLRSPTVAPQRSQSWSKAPDGGKSPGPWGKIAMPGKNKATVTGLLNSPDRPQHPQSQPEIMVHCLTELLLRVTCMLGHRARRVRPRVQMDAITCLL